MGRETNKPQIRLRNYHRKRMFLHVKRLYFVDICVYTSATPVRYYCVFPDINECNEKSSGCQQKCANTIGSFTCSCSDGYTLEADGVNCKQGQLYPYYRQLF